MRFTKILVPILFGIGLFGCNDSNDISGTYSNDEQQNLTITQSKDGKKFVVATKISEKEMISGKDILAPYKVVTYKKDNSLYELNNDNIVGTMDKEQFTLSKNGKIYKKKL